MGPRCATCYSTVPDCGARMLSREDDASEFRKRDWHEIESRSESCPTKYSLKFSLEIFFIQKQWTVLVRRFAASLKRPRQPNPSKQNTLKPTYIGTLSKLELWIAIRRKREGQSWTTGGQSCIRPYSNLRGPNVFQCVAVPFGGNNKHDDDRVYSNMYLKWK